MIIAIDFDGTIVEDHFPGIGNMMPKADECINALREAGHYVIINTCRNGESLINAINWLLQMGIGFDRVNDNHPEGTQKYGKTRKVYADVYIDDHNFNYGASPILEALNWLCILEQLKDE